MDLKLAVVSMRPGLDLILHLKHIEARGNIKVDMDSGDVTIMKPVDFKKKKQGQDPTAEFADLGVVAPILNDVAEIAVMFRVPMEVQGHTAGANCAFSRNLSQKRADLIIEHLAARGVERRLMQ